MEAIEEKLEPMAENVLSDLCIAQTSVIIPEGDGRRRYVKDLIEGGYVREDKELSDFFEATERGYNYFRKNS